MWQMSIPWWEFIARGVIVYVFLIGLLRMSGKRQIGQLAPFDLVLLLVLSNAVQNSMNGGDNSVIGGLISAVTLVGANYGLSWLTYRHKRLATFIEGRPQIIVHNGRVFHDVLEREKLTMHELQAAMRAVGCSSVEHIHFAVLENNGQISIRQLSAAEAGKLHE